MVAVEFLLPPSTRLPVLRAIGWIGLVVIVAADWRTARRWSRERGDKGSP
jgi:hypothetical protein